MFVITIYRTLSFFLACANYTLSFIAIYTSFYFFYTDLFYYKSKRVFIQATLLKCGRMFSLPQSMYIVEVGRVKVNKTNVNRKRLIKA